MTLDAAQRASFPSPRRGEGARAKRGRVRGQVTLDRLVPPHPDRFAIRPLPAGERWSKPRCPCINSPVGGEVSAMKGNIGVARRLRRDQTDAERALWFR